MISLILFIVCSWTEFLGRFLMPEKKMGKLKLQKHAEQASWNSLCKYVIIQFSGWFMPF